MFKSILNLISRSVCSCILLTFLIEKVQLSLGKTFRCKNMRTVETTHIIKTVNTNERLTQSLRPADVTGINFSLGLLCVFLGSPFHQLVIGAKIRKNINLENRGKIRNGIFSCQVTRHLILESFKSFIFM